MAEVQTQCRCGAPATTAVVTYFRSIRRVETVQVYETYGLDEEGNLADRLEEEEHEFDTEQDEPEINDRETQYVCDNCEAE